MKLQLIQIEAFDYLFSVKEKLMHSKAGSLLLIDQTGSPIFQNKKQAIIIQRLLKQKGKESGVVTQNSTAASILKDVGINHFYDLDSAQRFPWGANQLSSQNAWRAKKNRSSFHKIGIKESQVSPLTRKVSLVVGIASIIILAVLYIPSAEIKIKVPVINQTIQIPLLINSTNLTPGTNPMVVTPTITEVEVFQTAKVTGTINVPSVKAKGKIDFVNLTNESILIPVGLVLRSSVDEKKEYTTIESGEIQAGPGSMMSLKVESVAAGEAGNAEVGEISVILGPFGLRLGARNSEAILGGADIGKSYPSTTDRNKLRQLCLEELKNSAKSQIQNNLSPDEVFIPETLKISKILLEDYFPAEDTPTDVLSLSLRANVISIIIPKVKFAENSKPYFDATLPDKYFASSEITINNIKVEEVNPDGSINVIISASRIIKMTINLDEIKALSSGRPKKEVIQVLEQQYHQTAPDVITVHPGWIPDLPRIPFRISIKVEE
jgi:hypothetical protein